MTLEQRLKLLEKLLDNVNLTDDEFEKYNTEANLLQEEINAYEEKVRNLKTEQRQKIIERIIYLEQQGRMDQVINEFGGQFIDNYIITSNFEVRSLCKNPRNPNMTNIWHFQTHEECVLKVRMLVYYRVYDHYIRNNEE